MKADLTFLLGRARTRLPKRAVRNKTSSFTVAAGLYWEREVRETHHLIAGG